METRRTSETRASGARNDALIKQQVLLWLESIVRKVSVFSSGEGDVEFRVLPPEGGRGAYQIQVSKGKYSRRVRIDSLMVERRHTHQITPMIVRDLKNAVTSLVRLVQQRE
jgi:hypothetical protein